MSKRHLDIENEDLNSVKKIKNDDKSEDDEEEEEEKEPLPIAAVIENNDGTIHPTNKQYFVYKNTQPSMVSNTARFWSRKYLKILRHVNPDVYNLYIHNDFISYGELEVIENCLLDIGKGIFLKRKHEMSFAHYITSFRRLEALTILLDCTDNFSGIDDGERFIDIVRVIGACYITILRDLLPKSLFINEELTKDEKKKLIKISHQLPNFKEIIKRALIIGQTYLTISDVFSGYTNILQTIYCNWLLNIDHEKPDEDILKILKHAASISKDEFNESYDFIKELGIYSMNNPGLGGHSHDLSKWSITKRNLYSLDNMDDQDDFNENYWFRL